MARRLVRHFLGLEKPILHSVVDRLLAEYARDNSGSRSCDLRNQTIVLPSSLAARRLNELLVLRAEQEGVLLYPPKVVTLGTLPERFYVAKRPFASDLVQELAWVQALRSVPREQLLRIVPVPPADSSYSAWLELGKMLAGIHREAASERLDFGSVAAALSGTEKERWQALAVVQRAYLDLLDGIELWDVQTARLYALEHEEAQKHAASNPDQKVIAIACVDLNATQRGFLSAVADQVEIWIGADSEQSLAFDEFGCLNCSYWQVASLDLPPDSLLVTESPNDQAELVAGVLADMGDRYHVRELTIGVPDSDIIPNIRQQLDLCGVQTRYGPGASLTRSEPVRLLNLIAQYLAFGRYSDFAALVRHPAVEKMVLSSRKPPGDDWLSQLDRYSQTALPKQIDDFVNQDAEGAETYELVSQLIQKWLKKLNGKKLTASAWVQPVLGVLKAAYGNQQVDLSDDDQVPYYAAAKSVAEAIIALRDIPQGLEPTLTLSELIEWLNRSISGTSIPEPASTSAIEMLGWLELALDDAPGLILTGVHDGVLPESVNADAFLPNGLRRQLGLMDNARRYARDAYSMHVLIKTRQDLRVVVGRTSPDGDPLAPSRLLTACNLEELPGRVLHLVDEEVTDRLPPTSTRWKAVSGGSRLHIPQPPSGPCKLARMSVTAFRDYLASPYRFYLKHVLKLRDEDDGSKQLDAAGFGVLVHETLDGLGEGEMATCGDEEQIADFLVERLHQLADACYGPTPPPAVLIQIEQAEQRLKAFAPKQAQRARDGWEIKYVEESVGPEHDVRIGTEEHFVRLIGRIDRIDFHRETGRWAIWDYKTSESAKNPLSVHYSKAEGRWLDLQLPLYRHLAKKLNIPDEPLLGYISIPKQAMETGFFPAKFTDAQLAEADARAHSVGRAVRLGEFWTDDSPEDVKYDDFARICQSGVQVVQTDAPAKPVSRFQLPKYELSPADIAEAKTQLDEPTPTELDLAPEVIRASAGTGKTYQLSNRLLRIILAGHEVDNILATTFTRKAAGEIMHRVLQRLALACTSAARLTELGGACGMPELSTGRCLAALRRVTASIHRLRIGTLDSFFSQIARTFSLEMGLPPGWSTMDPVREPQFQLEAISRLLDGHDRRKLVELVRMLAKGESSRQVVEQVLQTVGSGYVIYRNTEPEAWDQLPIEKGPSESAIESALLTLENTRLNHKSADPQLEQLHLACSIGDWESVISHGIFARLIDDEPTYYRKKLPADLIHALGVIADRAAAELLPIRRSQTLASRSVLTAYDAEYTTLTRASRQLGFSDVAYYLASWLRKQQSSQSAEQAVAAMETRLDCGVEHLLLDEFQDTAPEQWEILAPLAAPLAAQTAEANTNGSDDGRSDGSFFCVGDTKQAIYGWRGGVAEIFDSVEDSVDGVQSRSLQTSYRSSPEVVQTVNRVFESLGEHSNFSDCDSVARQWSSSFPEHQTARQELAGYACLKNTPKVGYELTSEEKKEITLAYAADEIAELSRSTSASIGVLFRTNLDVARMIALLRARGVAASQDGGNPLTDSAAVQLVLSLVHLADHPGDRTCAFHVFSSPLASSLPFEKNEVAGLALWVRQQVTRNGLAAWLHSVADLLASELSWWDQQRLRQLIDLAYEFEQSGGGRLRDFEDAVFRTRVALPSAAQVKVMTIHMSKGLEFDAVFLPDLTVGLSSSTPTFVLRGQGPETPADGVLRYMNANLQAKLPEDWQSAFSQSRERGMVEALCMLYVAMTRARRGLYMYARPSSRKQAEFGSLLQSTLSDGKEQAKELATLYETGSPDWYKSLPPEQQAIQEATTVEQRSIQLVQDSSSAPARSLRISGPSTARQKDLTPLADAMSISGSVGATYGELFHSFFEQIIWLEDYKLDRDKLHQLARQTIPPEQLRHVSIRAAVQQFERMLDLPVVRQVLSRDRYQSGKDKIRVEVDNERPLNLVSDDRFITGTIDRLAVCYQDGKPVSAEIFDYKTDSYDERMTLLWSNERIEYHRQQMEIYAAAVSRLFGIELQRIEKYLVMLKTGDLLRVDCAQLAPAPRTEATVAKQDNAMLPF